MEFINLKYVNRIEDDGLLYEMVQYLQKHNKDKKLLLMKLKLSNMNMSTQMTSIK